MKHKHILLKLSFLANNMLSTVHDKHPLRRFLLKKSFFQEYRYSLYLLSIQVYHNLVNTFSLLFSRTSCHGHMGLFLTAVCNMQEFCSLSYFVWNPFYCISLLDMFYSCLPALKYKIFTYAYNLYYTDDWY